MRKLCFILTTLFPFFSVGQYVGDTIVIYIDNRVEMNITTDDFDHLRESDNAHKIIKSFELYLPKIASQLKTDRADLVRYRINETITVEEDNQKEIYLLKDGALNYTGIRDRAIIKSKEYTITINTTDLSKIGDSSLLKCYEKIIPLLPKKTNHSKKLFFECKNGEVKTLEKRNETISQIDALELSFGAGAGLVKNRWMGDFSLKLGASFNRKGAIKHNPYIAASLMYEFPSTGGMKINTFLSLGYRTNHDKHDPKGKMFGVELGYLISRQGDFFDKDTYRFSLNWSPANRVIVSPQMYINGGFENVYPGIRIGFGL